MESYEKLSSRLQGELDIRTEQIRKLRNTLKLPLPSSQTDSGSVSNRSDWLVCACRDILGVKNLTSHEIPNLLKSTLEDAETAKRKLTVANKKIEEMEFHGVRLGDPQVGAPVIELLMKEVQEMRVRCISYEMELDQKDALLNNAVTEIEHLALQMNETRKSDFEEIHILKSQCEKLAHRPVLVNADTQSDQVNGGDAWDGHALSMESIHHWSQISHEENIRQNADGSPKLFSQASQTNREQPQALLSHESQTVESPMPQKTQTSQISEKPVQHVQHLSQQTVTAVSDLQTSVERTKFERTINKLAAQHERERESMSVHINELEDRIVSDGLRIGELQFELNESKADTIAALEDSVEEMRRMFDLTHQRDTEEIEHLTQLLMERMNGPVDDFYHAVVDEPHVGDLHSDKHNIRDRSQVEKQVLPQLHVGPHVEKQVLPQLHVGSQVENQVLPHLHLGSQIEKQALPQLHVGSQVEKPVLVNTESQSNSVTGVSIGSQPDALIAVGSQKDAFEGVSIATETHCAVHVHSQVDRVNHTDQASQIAQSVEATFQSTQTVNEAKVNMESQIDRVQGTDVASQIGLAIEAESQTVKEAIVHVASQGVDGKDEASQIDLVIEAVSQSSQTAKDANVHVGSQFEIIEVNDQASQIEQITEVTSQGIQIDVVNEPKSQMVEVVSENILVEFTDVASQVSLQHIEIDVNLLEEVEALKSDLAISKFICQTVEEELDSLQKQYIVCTKQLTEWTKSVKESDEIIMQLKEQLAIQVAADTEELNELRASNDDLKLQLVAKEVLADELRALNEDTQLKLVAKEASFDEWRSANEDMKLKLVAHVTSSDELRAANENMKHQLVAKEVLSDELKAVKDDMKLQLVAQDASSDALRAVNDDMKLQLMAKEAFSVDFKTTCDELKLELVAAKSRAEELTLKLSMKVKELEELRTKYAQSQSSIQLTNCLEENKVLRLEIENEQLRGFANEATSRLAEHIELNKTVFDELQSELVALRSEPPAELVQLRSEKSNFDSEATNLRSELSALQIVNNSLEAKEYEWETAQTVLQFQLDLLRYSNVQLESELGVLKSECTESDHLRLNNESEQKVIAEFVDNTPLDDNDWLKQRVEQLECQVDELRVAEGDLLELISDTTPMDPMFGALVLEPAPPGLPARIQLVKTNVRAMVDMFNAQMESMEADIDWLRSQVECQRMQAEDERVLVYEEFELERKSRLKLELIQNDAKLICKQTDILWHKFIQFKKQFSN